MAEESRVAAKANTSENQSYTSTFTFGEQIREQGDTFIVMAQGGRAIDGGGSYERYEVGIDAEDQAVVLRKVTEQYRADDFVSAAHRTVTYQTVQPGQTATVIVEAEPSEGYDQVFITLDFSLVEIRSRDRGFTGSVFLTPGPESSLNFRVGNKDYGTFSVPSFPAQESGSFICPNGYRMFGFVETDNHDAWKNSQGAMSAEELGALQGVADNTSLPGANPVGFGPLPGTPEDFDPRAISQEVAFWWEGTRLHFASVSDDLGSLEVAVGFEGENAPPVSHALESEPAFERVIAAAEGLIAGDDPPEIKAWQDYPEPLDDAYPPPPVLTAAQQGDLMAAAPPAVDEEFGEMQNQNPATTLQDAETFFWLVARVDEEPVFADDNNAATEEWTATDRQAFLLLVASHGYNYSPDDGGAGPPAAGGAPAAGAANAMAAGWRGTPTTRTEITLPAELRNRGLLAKALKYLIERAVKGQLAYAEGTIFGVWDGIKGDVVGVADTVRMAAGGWDDAAIFIGRYLKDPYRVAAELNATFELVKEVKWSQVKANVKGMVDEMLKDFVGNQEDRLKLVLGDECEDPLYLTAYLAGYTGGFIGEQVGVAFFTAGISKAGVISQVLRAGRGAVGTLMGKAAAKFPQAVTLANGVARSTGVHVQNLSKGLYGEFSRTARSADELRATRRNASLCRTAAGCLAVGTLVAMADGSYRPIENVHTGDSVMTIDMENGGSISTQPVETQVRNEASRVFRITWDRDGDQVADGWVAATPEHPFWTEENGWTRADTLRRGMRLRTSAGTQAVVLDAMQQLGEIVTYNLDVSGPDTFLIGSHRETAILVHNLEGDVYPWHAPHRGVGQSAVLNFFTGQPAIHPSTGLPVIGNNPQHHFHYDAWLRANYTNLEIVDRRVNYPVIELTYEQHYHAHQAGEDWLLGKYGVRSSNMGELWKKVELSDMNQLADAMANAAIAKGAVIDSIKRNTLKNLCQASLHSFNKRGCPQ